MLGEGAPGTPLLFVCGVVEFQGVGPSNVARLLCGPAAPSVTLRLGAWLFETPYGLWQLVSEETAEGCFPESAVTNPSDFKAQFARCSARVGTQEGSPWVLLRRQVCYRFPHKESGLWFPG